MPRMGRVMLANYPHHVVMNVPGLPYHIVQRGNNREACFAEPKNYQFYLE